MLGYLRRGGGWGNVGLLSMLGYLRRGGWGNVGLLPMLGYLRRGRVWGNVGVLPMVGYLRRSRGVALSRISHFPVLVDVYIQQV